MGSIWSTSNSISSILIVIQAWFVSNYFPLSFTKTSGIADNLTDLAHFILSLSIDFLRFLFAVVLYLISFLFFAWIMYVGKKRTLITHLLCLFPCAHERVDMETSIVILCIPTYFFTIEWLILPNQLGNCCGFLSINDFTPCFTYS